MTDIEKQKIVNTRGFWFTKDNRIISIRSPKDTLCVDLSDGRTMGFTLDYLSKPIQQKDLKQYEVIIKPCNATRYMTEEIREYYGL